MNIMRIFLILSFFAFSCSKQETVTSSSSTPPVPDPVTTTGSATGGTPTTTGGTPTTTTGGGTPTTTSGGWFTSGSQSSSGSNGGGTGGGISCGDEADDGVGTGTAIRVFRATLGGQGSYPNPRQQDWRPGRASGLPEWVPTINEASLLFSTDSRLKVRVKVLPQWFPNAGVMGCDGRVTGMAADSYPYTKLKMRIVLRDVICHTNGTKTLAPNSYQDIVTSPINVNSCSQVYDFSDKRNPSACGTVVEIRDVMSDNTCQANGLKCPAEELVRKQSCWKAILQVVTDQTKDFP